MKKDDNELQALANWLSKNQEAILKKWENQMREMEETPSQLAAMSRQEFLNDIPDFLGGLCDSFEGKEISFVDIGKGHGAQRWDYNFDLQESVEEWGMLHKVLKKEVSLFMDEHGLHSDSLNRVHDTLSEHIQEGIEHSVDEYYQLQQSETEVQLHELKQALDKPEDMLRKHNLRSTSHDLKGIMYNLQIGFKLLQNEDLSSDVSKLVSQIKEEADHLEQLLNDLLDLFRLETNREVVNLSKFDAAAALASLCKSMQPMAESENLKLKYQGADTLRVKSDQKKVQRIVRNLLFNALKYTKEGYVRIGCEKITADQWLLEVSDTGPGLDETHAQSLSIDADSSETEEQNDFSLEQSDTSSKTGSHGEGIGLLIVRHLCRLLDASVEVDTQPGEGTTFRIIFPLNLSE